MKRQFFALVCSAVIMLTTTINMPVTAAQAEQASAPYLRAEIRTDKAVWVHLTGAGLPLTVNAWVLEDAAGAMVPLASVLPNGKDTALLTPAAAIDPRRVYYARVPALNLKARVRFDGWFRTLYSAKPLGATISPDGNTTSFRVFSPRATAVKLYLYDNATDGPAAAREVIPMRRDKDGVFEAILKSNLKGTWYDFTAHGPNDPGNEFYEQKPAHLSDPYALVQNESYGKSRVWDDIHPARPLKGSRPAMKDVVAYEVHVQDFTDLLPVGDDLKGTIPAMAVTGLTNSRGEPIGFDYLVNLGVNVVHLMPMQEYHHYPDSEWQAAFSQDAEMADLAIADENYQWGYSTTHAFAIENRYRQRGTEPGEERQQLADLIDAFHARGIAVIVDIVPNHTGEDMRGSKKPLNFNGFDKMYYYRTDDDGQHIGPYGNEVKTEDRPMVQRWIIDQAKHLIDAFGFDGFRIDLAGQLDEQTLKKLRAEVGENIIIYGEPWIDVTDPYIRANPDWDWYKEDAPITFFQDTARNAFKGSPFVLEDKRTDRGYAGGNASLRADAMKALTNDYAEERESPSQGLNYLDIHDNWALADRFATSGWDGRKGVDAGNYRIAATLLFTSQGPIVLHGGSEIMRSKGLSKIEDVVKQSSSGEVRLKGRDDTYNQRAPNWFQWEQVGQTEGPNNYKAMHAFWKGLIDFRLSEAGEVFRQSTHVSNQYQWILPADESLLGYIIGGEVLVLLNVGEASGTFEDITLPEGDWMLVASDDAVDHINGVAGSMAKLTGDTAQTFEVPAAGVRIWRRK
ncbi:alpha-amylase family glycosyl hydrolase [Kordiimonas aestuarii]|uniref:alpha-amylase family glycosyl hydrolase n=1 Tax=Kordiimonas aestuarii TaxID=1005925 RepID=UPI0021D00F57|nr:alpha-amylase family glycosyl hydrolase [Kordiimonas aestuarii]